MRQLFTLVALASLAGLTAGTASAVNVSVDFSDPAGGWTYAYTGDASAAGSGGFTALDGTWNHDNGSDAWDGSAIGSGGPGGVTSALIDGSASYARIQDPGDTRGNGFSSPSDPNRKLFFGHDISADGDSLLDDGITISFRTKISTGSTLDPVYTRNAGGVTTPWPAGGNGYTNFSNGRGMFGVNEQSSSQAAGDGTATYASGFLPARIGFSLATSADLAADVGQPDPLGAGNGAFMLNDLDSNVVSEAVDLLEGAGGPNYVVITDAELANWHEFWITIQADASNVGTHLVTLYMDGNTTPVGAFKTTAGYDSSPGEQDFADTSFLSMGMGSSGDFGAYDVDFFSYRAGVFAPVPEPTALCLVSLACVGFAGCCRRRS
ncbi:MAG: hypothetical protein KDA57_09220 [Planctomycetales bacterium]|nr:hypothetical protein [Planctomycetales bacterium]